MTMQGMKVEHIDKYPGMGEKEINRLATAIVDQAIMDYMLAVRDNNKRMKRDCEEFFESTWFFDLQEDDGNIKGETVIRKLYTGVKDFVRIANDCFDAGRVSHVKKSGEIDPLDIAFRCPICGGKTYISFQVLRSLRKTKQNIYGFKAHCYNCDFKLTRDVLYRRRPSKMSENTCICCGAIIPEGRQVCPMCEYESEELNNGKKERNCTSPGCAKKSD